MATETRSLKDHIWRGSLRWGAICIFGSFLVSLAVATIELRKTTAASLGAELTAAARAYRLDILSGEYKRTELSITKLLKLNRDDHVKILNPELEEFYHDQNLSLPWSPKLVERVPVWTRLTRAQIAVPIFFDLEEKYLLGFVAAELSAHFNWELAVSMFLTMVVSQLLFAWTLSFGVLKIGTELGAQLKQIEDSVRDPSTNASKVAEIQSLVGLFGSLRSQLDTLKDLKSNPSHFQQVAHDIRSPLSALSIGIQSLKNIPEPTERLLRAAFVRIEGIARDILREPNPGAAVGLPGASVAESFAGCEALIREKQLEFESKSINWNFIKNAHEDGTLGLELTFLMRILSNVLNNAAEASPINSKIEITAGATEHKIEFSVRDYGSGIHVTLLNSVLAGGVSTKSRGSGIGLSSAQKLLSDHGGSLNLQNLDDGFRVTVRLPFKRSIL